MQIREGARRRRRRTPVANIRVADATPEHIPTIAHELHPGDADAADHRGRPALRARPGRPRARGGLQGAGRHARRRGARPGARVQADRDLARRVPARHARLDDAQPSQAGPGDCGTSRCRSSRSTRTASTACRAARSRSSPSRRRPRASRRAFDAHQGVRRSAPQAPADRRRQRRRAAEHQGTAAHDDIDIDHRVDRRRSARDPAQTAVRLRRARPAAAGHLGLRRAEPMRDDEKLRDLPVVVFTGKELSRRARTRSCKIWRARS